MVEVLSRNLLGETEKDHEEPQSETKRCDVVVANLTLASVQRARFSSCQ